MTLNTVSADKPDREDEGMHVDDLANEIRRVDGDHLNRLGAGALAEALMPFINRRPPDVAVLRETDELVEKVARAICKAAFGDESPWPEYAECARAAIRAMLSSAPSAAEGDRK